MNEISCAFESSELVPDDVRPEAAARAIDDALACHLDHEIGPASEGAPRISHASDRARWLCTRAASGAIPLLASEEEPSVFFNARTVAARSSPYGHATIRAMLELPASYIANTARVVAGVGRALQAYWGMATPQPARDTMVMQRVHPGQKRVPPLGLPKLKGGIVLASTAVPHELGWINYWPAPAAALLGFPDPDRDAEWLPYSTKLDDGGWIVQLTADPLDLERPEHLDAVKRAYKRFAAIGRAARR